MADLNLWLALSWGSHPHSQAAWRWFDSLANDEVLYCRFTQIGLLRLLTTQGVMQSDCLTVGGAWTVYDRWLRDPRVAFRQEPAGIDALLRRAAGPILRTSAPKMIGDCYLLAMSQASNASLVTFDQGLARLAGRFRHEAILLV